jgi:hypothetical protein
MERAEVRGFFDCINTAKRTGAVQDLTGFLAASPVAKP